MSLDSSLIKNLWNYSDNLKEKYGIEDAFRGLEKKYLLNRNIIIFCCWLAKQQYEPLTTQLLKPMLVRITPWHEKIVIELLSLKNSLPKVTQHHELKGLFQSIDKNVIYAERVEQSLLVKYLYEMKTSQCDESQQINNALSNIFKYIEATGAVIHKTDLEKVYRIVKNSFDENRDGQK